MWISRSKSRECIASWGAAGDMVSESNPLVVREAVPRILWGDLHGHSQLSDGTGTLDDYFWYAP